MRERELKQMLQLRPLQRCWSLPMRERELKLLPLNIKYSEN